MSESVTILIFAFSLAAGKLGELALAAADTSLWLRVGYGLACFAIGYGVAWMQLRPENRLRAWRRRRERGSGE